MAKKRKKNKTTREPAPPQGTSVNRLGVVVSVLLLVALAAAVAYVGRVPREAADVSPPPADETTDLERWQASPVRDLELGSAYALGPEDAPVTIVEFSDFECPFCKQAAGYLTSLRAQYGDKLRLVFKDFPLDSACNPHIERQTHALACKAAVLARCAGAEGRFWEMHDAIFALPSLTHESLRALASTLGLGVCDGEEEIVARIQADVEEGRKLGVTATPTLFVNGREALNREEGIRTIVDHILSSP